MVLDSYPKRDARSHIHNKELDTFFPLNEKTFECNKDKNIN